MMAFIFLFDLPQNRRHSMTALSLFENWSCAFIPNAALKCPIFTMLKLLEMLHFPI